MGPPVLWHLKVSNYNEKARWTLDYKGIPHERRAGIPGEHSKIAQKLTGGSTFPVLIIDGEAIGDSTAIIAELERRYPDPPLYPADPDLRRQALELEDYFDEQLGAHVRLLVIHSLLPEPGLMMAAFTPDASAPRRAIARVTWPLLRRRLNGMFGIDDDSVARAYAQIAAAGERLRSRAGPKGYLCGDTFTVADLTLASLVGPAVAPEQFPYAQPQRDHPALAPLRDALDQAGIREWTRDMYARHRGTSAEVGGDDGTGAAVADETVAVPSP